MKTNNTTINLKSTTTTSGTAGNKTISSLNYVHLIRGTSEYN